MLFCLILQISGAKREEPESEEKANEEKPTEVKKKQKNQKASTSPKSSASRLEFTDNHYESTATVQLQVYFLGNYYYFYVSVHVRILYLVLSLNY